MPSFKARWSTQTEAPCLVLAEIKELQIAAARNGSSLKPNGLVERDQAMDGMNIRVDFDWLSTV